MTVDLRDTFGKISDSLIARFNLTTEGENRLTKGEKREDIVRGFLRENLPATHGVDSGEIFDSTGKISKQCDVIIYNNSMPALRSKDLNLFPIDSVFGTCEVKTDLEKHRLKEAVENVRSVKSMRLTPPSAFMGRFRDRAYGMIFAFDGPQSAIRANLTELYEELKVPKEEQVDLICVLNKFVGMGYPKEQGITIGSEGKDLADQPLVFLNTGKDSLLFFVPLMLGGFNKPVSSFLNFWSYMRPAGYPMF